MAKPIKLIMEIKGEDANKFVKQLKKPRLNSKRAEAIQKARKLEVVFA